MSISVQFLGTGTSVGVPQIGCSCPTCTSADPRDKRRRTGAYIRTRKTAFLVDTPPEMRLACVELGIVKVDAVVVTHCHMDHVGGFDDVRRFNTLNGERVPCAPNSPGANGREWRIVGKPMPCYGSAETLESLRRIFPYVSAKPNEQGLFRPQIVFTPVEDGVPFEVGDVRVTPFSVKHGPPTFGYLFEHGGRRIGYASDCAEMPQKAVELLRGADELVLDCLRERPHPTHFNLEQALECVRLVAPKSCHFVHMCHEVLHADFESRLPSPCRLAHDGLELDFPEA